MNNEKIFELAKQLMDNLDDTNCDNCIFQEACINGTEGCEGYDICDLLYDGIKLNSMKTVDFDVALEHLKKEDKMIKSALTKNRFVIRYGKLISYDIHDNKEYHDCRLEDIISKEEKDGKWHILKGNRF